jgi:glycosyl transferase family 2
MSPDSYTLVTAAYNEGGLIESTIRSVVAQDLRPAKWVIVSDGSTDDTDAIVRRYQAEYDFIQLLRLTEDHPRNFAAQAIAINAGFAQLDGVDCKFTGNLDADITMEPSYFARLLEKFHDDPKLGVAGGFLYEKGPDGIFRCRPRTSVTSVAHAVQLFRRACFQDIGAAYLPLPYGGPDTYAEISARMKGWRVASFPDLKVLHHRRTGSAGGMLRGCFRQGRMDYSLGTLPRFELFRVLRRADCAPVVIGAIARLAGFLHCYCCRERPSVPEDFRAFLRREQAGRIADLLRPGKVTNCS